MDLDEQIEYSGKNWHVSYVFVGVQWFWLKYLSFTWKSDFNKQDGFPNPPFYVTHRGLYKARGQPYVYP